MVGFHLAQALSSKHTVVRVARRSQNADINADLSSEEGLAKVLDCSPDVVINAVKPALSVDEMETQREVAYELNTLLPERLANLQKKLGFLLVQIGTDGVYAGKCGETYEESSPTAPPNYYCLTKAMAEEKIMHASEKYLILRTEGVFGYDEKGTNFFMRMQHSEKQGKTFAAASDQFSQPICGLELARLAEALIAKKKTGIYNACGKDYLSRFQLADKIKKIMGWNLKLAECSIRNRKVAVQPCLRVDVSKIEAAAGKISPLDTQISGLKGWMGENKNF